MNEFDVPIGDGVALRPLADTPRRELEVWRDASLRESLARGLAQAAAGDTHDFGSFVEHLMEPEPPRPEHE